ncbi:hypothetical protein CHCC20331_3904 [Bacillus paralicheniformis]|uniref:Uncharacterized protein n=1 Tax=Bacillus paralicheniformis TaxID=1648923 RepID=A0A7Z0X1T8_9BACI|nr:hypothetical protein B4121_0383 [Bacillus paralicheniformis]TWJ54342.1 hypothetical protein CHCC5022_0325 [Bacillus paralicheniformis]TWJ80534.1 hypothetical protein CHCC4186_0130 [Bacillus paralicheniformis]TWK26777.1 hypothetical protein CHCC20372_1821 [Bacillus paralicheniformis]TWK38135.1 hypothetical protein CHCC20348_3547 [Bacillus paralicheniformis]
MAQEEYSSFMQFLSIFMLFGQVYKQGEDVSLFNLPILV